MSTTRTEDHMSKTHSKTLILPSDLEACELFVGLKARALSEIAQQARVVHFSRGSRIFAQGDAAEHAHVVLKGSVKIVQSGRDGEQVILRFIRPGETFGTVGIFVDGRYPADAVAALDSLDARWPRRTFDSLIEKHPVITLNLVRLMGLRLRELQNRVRELSSSRVEQRIAGALSRLAATTTDKGYNLNLPLSRRDIAELAGTTIYTASRILTGWTKQGILASGRARITVLKPEALFVMALRSE